MGTYLAFDLVLLLSVNLCALFIGLTRVKCVASAVIEMYFFFCSVQSSLHLFHHESRYDIQHIVFGPGVSKASAWNSGTFAFIEIVSND